MASAPRGAPLGAGAPLLGPAQHPAGPGAGWGRARIRAARARQSLRPEPPPFGKAARNLTWFRERTQSTRSERFQELPGVRSPCPMGPMGSFSSHLSGSSIFIAYLEARAQRQSSAPAAQQPLEVSLASPKALHQVCPGNCRQSFLRKGLVGIWQPPAFLKSHHCLFMPLENVLFNGGSLKSEEDQPKMHLEATKIILKA